MVVRLQNCAFPFVFVGVLVFLLTGDLGAAESRAGLTPVPFTDVKLADRFWAPRLEINRTVTIPHCIKECEDTGRIRNFEVAAGLVKGKHEGYFFNDSDVYKVIEAAAYSLAIHPDPKLDAKLDELIGKIAAAQQKDGYLNTYFTLVEPDKRWTDLPVKHELYCAGHLIEAAVAHYRATGKRNLLDVAIRFADYIDSVFGEGRLVGVPGHEEIELALVKLYELTGKKNYFDLAKFFIDKRGYGNREYSQDHIPVRQHSEIVGHAVRAMYLYSGVADVAAYTGDKSLVAAMERVWRDVTQRKMYVTGGIGPSAHNEGFTIPYDLPNDSAYAETCAGIGLAFWNHRLLLLHGDAKYADILERVLYNGAISGVSLDGARFFYVNPLSSRGFHHRQPWFGCACCPPNVARLIAQVGGYFYATSSDGLWVKLYAASSAKIKVGACEVELVQETDYPWSGVVKLTVNPSSPAAFDVNLRIPGWCKGAKVAVNGEAVEASPGENGYVKLHREWRRSDMVSLDMPMPVRRIVAHPRVSTDAGRVALQRGPVVYCLEGVDNGGSVRDIALPRETKLEASFEKDLLGGVVVVRGKVLRRKPLEWSGALYQASPDDEEVSVVAIPYYAWDNRQPGEMVVWIPETPAFAEAKLPPTIAREGKPGASFVYGSLRAINDGLAPSSSDDHSVPRHTWWDHKGTSEWVSLSFEKPQRISCVEVYWFDDTGIGGCRVPKLWEVQWLDGETWQSVSGASRYEVVRDAFNRVTFDPVETTSIKLVVQLQEGMSGGVLEIRLPK